MSNVITGITTGGFFPRSPTQIELDYQRTASGILEEINLGPGDPLYQIFKVPVLREFQMELFLQEIVSGLSIYTARGVFLDKHGENKGIWRKGPQKAGGIVRLTFSSPATGTNYALEGIVYKSKTSLPYVRSAVGAWDVPSYIAIKRGITNIDNLPEPYISMAGTGYVDSQSNGAGTSYAPIFNPTYQYFNWSGIGTAPATGATYYVNPTGNMTVKDDIVASEAGTGYNIGANAITTWTNVSVPVSISVNNPASITGGTSWEDDEPFRTRILNVTNATFTLTNVKDIANSINGVRAAHVYQALGTDRTSSSGSWSTAVADYVSGINITGNYSGVAADERDIVSGSMWTQRFSPGDGIVSLKEIIFRGKRTGYPPPLVCGVRKTTDASYLTSGIFDTFDVSPPAGTAQDFKIPMDSLDMEASETFLMEFWCGNKSGATGVTYWGENYWTLFTTSGVAASAQSGNLGDDITGYLYYQADTPDVSGNLAFKTRYGTAAFKVDLAMLDGYTYLDAYSLLDGKLDWVEGSGYACAGVDYSINQATEISIFYNATVYLVKNATSTFDAITDRLDIMIEQYVEALAPAENVVYSEIYYLIMSDPEIWRLDQLRIYESGGAHLNNEDIYIDEGSVAVFGGSTVNQG